MKETVEDIQAIALKRYPVVKKQRYVMGFVNTYDINEIPRVNFIAGYLFAKSEK